MSRGQRGGSARPLISAALDRSRYCFYFFVQVAPHLSPRGWVDLVPDPLLPRKAGSTGNGTRDLWFYRQKL
jgi:hypothetical protein